ncbi:cytosolic carboxypeptidase 2 isoform X2 [Trichomycterus rosablanca]|uniref:cytosolic carboxypeptidase 2 isoform X2 n=1 Tax=Trichomycterus rosablanca TaxID=2290929 RepID=UPI002F358BB9
MQTSDDPYEKFILQHLKHYGLFTAQGSSSFQRNFSIGRLWDSSHNAVSTDRRHSLADQSHSTADSSDMEEEEPQPHQEQLSFNMEKYLRTRQLLIDFEGGRPVPRLREPQALFSIPSSSCPLQSVRWPVECGVICDKINHIEWDPPEPEPFYQQTGFERTPMPVSEEKGTTVYCIDSAMKTPYFTSSCVGGRRRHLKSFSSGANSQETPTLSFESRFESGNLQKAVKIGLYDYELTLRSDMYTTKHTQWFYFRVKNMKAGFKYRFTIINLMKSSSLYEAGMRPLLYSELGTWYKGEGWHRAGNNIRYYRNQSDIEGNALYSLTWTLQFPYDNDTCYFAHCYPYTYSDLQDYLRVVVSNPVTALYCKVRVLCRSLAGNSVYVLTITAPGSWQEQRNKRAVVVTARVHPGETNSSWMMQGFLDFLLGESADARLLRETFVFKVVPMLNPDGVVVGNYRCSLAGRDLNRYYCTLLRDLFPCVWYTRNMVKRLLAVREVVLYCDFHGHSRKNNVFMYGCNDSKDPSVCLQERVFPLMMSKNAKDKFSFRSCKFKMQKSKEGTGRIVMWRLGIKNSYTMESTFGGSTLGDRKGTHFSIRDLKSLGYHFCDTLLDFCDPDQTKTALCLTELGALLKQEIKQKLGKDVDSLDDLTNVDIESSTNGSNSTESDGLPAHLLSCTDQNVKVKKKHLRSRKERNRLRQQRAQSTESKESLLLNENFVTERTEEETTPMKEIQDKRQKGQLGRINQPGRTWIPHPTKRIAVADHVTFWGEKPDRRQLQRQPLIVTAIKHRLLSLPVQHYPMPFSEDVRAHPEMRGRSAVSNITLHRIIPDFIPDRHLEPCRSTHFFPTRSANQLKLRREQTTQSTIASLKCFTPEIQNSMGAMKTNHNHRNAAGLDVLHSEHSIEAKQFNKQKTEDSSFLPNLKTISRHGTRHEESSGDAGLRALRLAKLPGRREDAISSGSRSNEERSNVLPRLQKSVAKTTRSQASERLLQQE